MRDRRPHWEGGNALTPCSPSLCSRSMGKNSKRSQLSDAELQPQKSLLLEAEAEAGESDKGTGGGIPALLPGKDAAMEAKEAEPLVRGPGAGAGAGAEGEGRRRLGRGGRVCPCPSLFSLAVSPRRSRAVRARLCMEREEESSPTTSTALLAAVAAAAAAKAAAAWADRFLTGSAGSYASKVWDACEDPAGVNGKMTVG